MKSLLAKSKFLCIVNVMIEFLRHFFVPHARNNHRAKLLHNTSLLFIAVGFLLLAVSTRFVYEVRPDILGLSYSISEVDMLVRINALRQEKGLGPLTLNGELSSAARAKASDMFAKNYWAHFAPDGSSSPWVFIKNSGYNYLYAGENLAKGFSESGEVVSAWMNSPSHRDNILSTKYKDIGFAIVPGNLQNEETVLVVEMFGSRSFATSDTKVNVTDTSKAPVKTAQATRPSVVQGLYDSQGSIKQADLGMFSSSPRLDLKTYTRNIAFVVLLILSLTFLGDFIITTQKQIPRLVGHNIDHILLVSFFILFMVLQRVGVIL